MRLVTLLGLTLLTAGPVLGQTLTHTDPRVVAAVEHAAGQARAAGASAGEVADLLVTDAYADERTGSVYVYVRQSIDAIGVGGSEMTIAMDRVGRPVHTAGRPVVGLENRTETRTATLSAAAAVTAASSIVGAAAPALTVAEADGGPDRRTVFATPESALAPLTARLIYHAAENGSVRLGWEVGPLETAEGPHAWMVRVDAQTGQELWRADLTAQDPIDPILLRGSAAPWREDSPAPFLLAGSTATPDQYRVYPSPLEGPNEGDRVLMINPANALASPLGWHDIDGVVGAEYTITRGNNVHAYLDTDNDNSPDVGLDVDGGPTLTFDFPVDLTQHPSTYRPAAVTNNFFWSNFIHDIAYQYGFTEAAGNFQVNNYGRGGLGNDDLRAEAQDGGGTNNANFSTPADGSRPRMQMYLYTLTNPWRDGDFSNMTLVHEYSHGISNRLTGGPTVTGCLSNSEQMGEGWGDWLSAMLTMVATDTRLTHRPYGTYPRGLSPTGPGLRPAALNTNFAFNDYHYGHTRTGHPVNGTLAVPHGIGFVWSTILWEVAWDLIDVYGFSPDFYDAGGSAGNQVIIRLVIEGMKLQPCRPGFVSGRNAILAADEALYGGIHTRELWTGFARRGLGFSASEGSTSTNSDNMEAFDVPFPPAQAAVTPDELEANVPNGGTVDETVELANLASTGSQDLTFTAAIVGVVTPEGDAPNPETAEDEGGTYFSVDPVAGAVSPGDVATLTVTFDATNPPAGIHTATLRLTTNDPANATIDVPLTMTAGGAVTISGGPGWRMMGAPSPGLTVDHLAAQNLVEGIPGYYPTELPNLYTIFNGQDTATPPAGGSDSLTQGRGFIWYFYDETFDPGGASQSVGLPMNVEAPASAAPVPAIVEVDLYPPGHRFSLLANPFRSSLNVAEMSEWATGGQLASAVAQVWDPGAGSYRLSTTEGGLIAAWQGMMVENDDATALAIPATAQTDGGIFHGLGGDESRLLAFELEGTDATTGTPLFDHAAAVYFGAGAVDDWDLRDATKLTPLGASSVALGIEGVRDSSVVLKAQESRRFNPQAAFDLTLDFAAVGTGTSFTLRWPSMVNFPDDWGFQLVDLETSATIDLRAASSYTFSATPAASNPGDATAPPLVAAFAGGTARFVLHVTPGVPTGTPASHLPTEFALAPPAPNPATAEALMRFDLPEATDVTIEVFDLVGRRVTTPMDARLEAGRHSARLDAGALAAGVYVVRMRAGEFVAARRLVVRR